MPVAVRHALLFVATVLAGLVATLLAPLLPAHAAGAQTVLAQSAGASTIWTRAVATRALQRGDTLRLDDFALADTLVQRRPPAGLDTTTPQAGWVVQRAVSVGEWLRRPAVVPPPAVSAGQPVHAVWQDGAVRLAVSAVALNTAPIGGAVSVRVGRTRRLDGIVIAPDSVRLR
jgi:flagella basal body P-ring formation protein FlgA